VKLFERLQAALTCRRSSPVKTHRVPRRTAYHQMLYKLVDRPCLELVPPKSFYLQLLDFLFALFNGQVLLYISVTILFSCYMPRPSAPDNSLLHVPILSQESTPWQPDTRASSPAISVVITCLTSKYAVRGINVYVPVVFPWPAIPYHQSPFGS
jgi:hypothetical protein